MVVLIITHDENRRTRVSEYLREKAYDVVFAPHRQDVHGVIREKQPHVIILDLYMTEPSGIETLNRLRAEGFKGKIVVLGGSSISHALRDAQRVGVDQVVGALQAVDGALDVNQIEYAIRACFRAEIAAKARQIWEAQGMPKGQDAEHWAEAERQVLGLRKAP